MKKITYAVVAIFSIAVIMVSCKKEAKKEKVKEAIKVEKQEMHNHNNDMASAAYQCPMDCEQGKTYDKEGNCPVCNMKLKKVESKDLDTNKVSDSTKISYNMNFKNCGKTCSGKMSCKGKTDCKSKTDCKAKTAMNKKSCSKCDPANCTSKGNLDTDKKMCTKCKTKSCKGSCKGKA
jgi:hypothetical protein